MTTQAKRAALSAAPSLMHATLRATLPMGGSNVQVDEAAGIIRGAAVMKIGPALGHGFTIDATTIKQVESLGNASPGGIKIRFRHPQITPEGLLPDDLGDVIGYVNNLRIDGDTVRGDVHLEDYAAVLPGLGDVRTYLLRRAKSRPETFGLSCVIGFETEVVTDSDGNPASLVARVHELAAIDVVGQGAATPNGLLAQKPEPIPETVTPAVGASPKAPETPSKPVAAVSATLKKGPIMDPKMKNFLAANHGLAADATDEAAQAMFDGLSADDQAKCRASMSQQKPAADVAQLRNQVVTDDGDKFLALEGKRVAQIQQLGNTLSVPAHIVSLEIAKGSNVIDARKAFLAHLVDCAKPVAGATTISVGEDKNRASLIAALPDTLRLKAQCKIEKPHERAQELRGLKFVDLGRHYLAAHGVGQDAWTLSATKVVDMLFRPREHGWQYAQLAQSTGSFTNITLDAANKTLRQAYLDGNATWTVWARRATAPDFKNVNRIALSDGPGLSTRTEAGEIKFAVMSDSKESYALSEYTSGIRLTRQSIINDDMDAFGRIPMLQGSAARRKEDDVVYAILTANAALADTGLLFNTTAVTTAGGHANYTSSGTAISVTSMGVARKTMRLQTGPKGAYLNLIPRFLIVPAALEALADQYTSSQFVPAISSSVNPFMQGGKTPLQPVIEPRLDATSAVSWYMAADTNQIDTVECCFLESEPEPVLKQEVDFDTDDVKFAVRHTVAAKAIDYRGLYLNAGA